MKILSLSTVFPRPGEPRLGLFVRNRLAHMAGEAEIRVLAPAPWIDVSRTGIRFPEAAGRADRREGGLRICHPRWYYPPGLGDWNGQWLAWSLAGMVDRLRREFRFDLIDAHFAHPEGDAASRLARRYGCPYTITLRGNETMHAEAPRKRRLIAAALCGAAAVIGVSRRLADFAIELGVEPHRAHVIPNGIDGSIYYRRDRDESRRELGMDPARTHILSAGYLIERKGHHRVIESLAGLRSAGADCELWIAGEPGKEGDYEPQIRAAAERFAVREYVHLTGPVAPPQLATYMSAADVFCLASSREGWPNVVNEALACGTPVVASDVGGVPEMLPGGEYGIVVDPRSQTELTGALRSALSRDWDGAAIARWGGSRTWENVALDTLAVLRTAAGQAR